MELKKGTSRWVILLPSIGIVIKLPIVNLIGAFSIIRACFKAPKLINKLILLYDEIFVFPTEYDFSVRKCLFLGIKSNWLEFSFYLDDPNDFRLTTYFSLFGLITIQELGKEPCTMSDDALYSQLFVLTDGGIFADHHHFNNTKNFCIKKGKLKIFDYGSWQTHWVVKKFGNLIYEKFNPKIIKWDHDKKFEEQLVAD